MSVPVIRWNQTIETPWYMQASSNDEHLVMRSSDAAICQDPGNLPEQFMNWFRESHSDPTMLIFLSDVKDTWNGADVRDSTFEDLVWEADFCRETPSTAPDSKVMERALCPWEWRLNRDENREPKIISEAHCLCRQSRGSQHADCVPIKRDFPVLKRIFCDENGRYQYHRAYETVTVGCHSVMPRIQRAAVPEYMVQSRMMD